MQKLPKYNTVNSEKKRRFEKIRTRNAKHQNELIKEEVTAENISEVIAKWTGIPVTKLLQSEREKIIKSRNRTPPK